jgi:hypothetical protein
LHPSTLVGLFPERMKAALRAAVHELTPPTKPISREERAAKIAACDKAVEEAERELGELRAQAAAARITLP